MANGKDGKTIIDRVWDLFSSITLAVIVFTLISATSIVGTILEQGAEPERNIKLLAKFFGEAAAPGVFNFLDLLHFTNMYHSWWFLAFLFVFSANLVICSLDRLPKIWKLVKDPVKPLADEHFNLMPIKREVELKKDPTGAKTAVEGFLREFGFKANVGEGEHALQLFCEKGRYGRLGVYVVHLSILIILAGAVAGIFWGFNGFLNLPEGATSSVAYLGNDGKERPLGFEIRCEDFDVSYYDNSDTPKSYKSWLTVLENGKPVKIDGREVTEINVNTPLRYKGITFYQSSYGYQPTRESIFRFAVTSKNGTKTDIEKRFGESFNIPGTDVSVKIADFSPAISTDQTGRIFTYAEKMSNPAVFLEFSKKGKENYKQWVLKRFPKTWDTQDGSIEFRDLWGAQYTGMQVRKDPGVWIVYLGCLVMGIGLYGAFFMNHIKIWIKVVPGNRNSSRIYIAATANKNRFALEQKIDRMIKKLTEEI